MCGIIGVFGQDAARIAAFGLHRLQHRGQEAAGIVSSDSLTLSRKHGLGLVAEVFAEEDLQGLPGFFAIGQTRYSTTGSKRAPDPLRNTGPLYAELDLGPVAIAHNGNLKGETAMRNTLKGDGAIFQTDTDTEVLIHLLARSKQAEFGDRLVEALQSLPIAYSFVILTREHLYAVRDPKGIRPLVLGKLNKQQYGYVVASETTALDIVGAEYMREIEPGEILKLNFWTFESRRFAKEETPRPCIFEYVYFARPDSDGGTVMRSREEAGKLLARHHKAAAEIVIGVPDSGIYAAQGYAETLGLPLRFGLVRSHFGRAFLNPTDADRARAVTLKHSVVEGVVKGKSVVLIDDSLVRGQTLSQLITLVREKGARAVHVRIASPRVVHPCYYGIDTPTFGELFANKHPTDERMAQQLGADSVEFLTVEELKEAVGEATGKKTFCTTCFTEEKLH